LPGAEEEGEEKTYADKWQNCSEPPLSEIEGELLGLTNSDNATSSHPENGEFSSPELLTASGQKSGSRGILNPKHKVIFSVKNDGVSNPKSTKELHAAESKHHL